MSSVARFGRDVGQLEATGALLDPDHGQEEATSDSIPDNRSHSGIPRLCGQLGVLPSDCLRCPWIRRVDRGGYSGTCPLLLNWTQPRPLGCRILLPLSEARSLWTRWLHTQDSQAAESCPLGCGFPDAFDAYDSILGKLGHLLDTLAHSAGRGPAYETNLDSWVGCSGNQPGPWLWRSCTGEAKSTALQPAKSNPDYTAGFDL